jgi:DNA-binding transcriptional ArsR family regulator
MGKIKISEDLLKVKDLIGRNPKVKMRNVKEEVLTQLQELGHRVDSLEKMFKKGETNVSLKRKKEILFLLKGREMSPSEVGRALSLSRTRTNEYLKLLEKEKFIEGKFKGKSKYYTLKVRE